MRLRRRSVSLDDVPSVELLSPINRAFCQRELTSMVLAGTFTDPRDEPSLYARRLCPSPLSVLGIAAAELATMVGKRLPAFDRVEVGQGRQRSTDDRLFAFGPRPQCVIFFNRDNHGIVHDLWLRTTEADAGELEQMAATLAEIGRRWELLLVDWRAGDIVTLARTSKVHAYLARHARSPVPRRWISRSLRRFGSEA